MSETDCWIDRQTTVHWYLLAILRNLIRYMQDDLPIMLETLITVTEMEVIRVAHLNTTVNVDNWIHLMQPRSDKRKQYKVDIP